MRIVFMGTPEFARVSLSALIARYGAESIAAVFCQPDKPQGRKMTITPPPTKVEAAAFGIPAYQPRTLRDAESAELLKSLEADLFAVVAYGKILPPEILEIPPLGCINVHGSLLPKYRGAAPIQASIMAGDAEVGVTTMLMGEQMDTGDMLMKDAIPLLDTDDFGTVHDKLAVLGAELLIKTIDAITGGTAVRTPQDHAAASYVGKIGREDCVIDFDLPVRAVWNKIRALSPAPLAETTLDGRGVKIVRASIVSEAAHAYRPGGIITASGGKLIIACKTGTLGVETLLPEGKKQMSVRDFLNGVRLQTEQI